ncbi:hypothetical protein EMMF5_000349 [Cystobasidiomycetes sp. EMM_F5]
MFVVPKMDETLAQITAFRKVLWTGEHSQLVSMTVPSKKEKGEIGEEVHTVDQTLIFTSGTAKAIISGEERDVGAGDVVVVPAGCKHNFITTSDTPLVLITVYAPAEHNEKTIHKSLDEGEKLEDEGKDEPPEWSQKGPSKD